MVREFAGVDAYAAAFEQRGDLRMNGARLRGEQFAIDDLARNRVPERYLPSVTVVANELERARSGQRLPDALKRYVREFCEKRGVEAPANRRRVRHDIPVLDTELHKAGEHRRSNARRRFNVAGMGRNRGPHQLFDEVRAAFGEFADARDPDGVELRRRRCQARDETARVDIRERTQLDARDRVFAQFLDHLEARGVALDIVGPDGGDEEYRSIAQRTRGKRKQLERGEVGPLRVVDRNGQRCTRGSRLQPVDDVPEARVLRGRGIGRARAVRLDGRKTELTEEVVEGSEWRVQVLEAPRHPGPAAAGGRALEELREEPGLSDAGAAPQHNDATVARSRALERFGEPVEFAGASD